MKINKFKAIIKNNPKGDIIKLINSLDKYIDFKGEIYISKIKKKNVKAWKLHKKANLNLFIINGKVKFVTIDKNHNFKIFILETTKHNRLFIPKGTIFGFQNIDKKESMILSISDIVYDMNETINFKINDFEYNWI